MSMIVLENVSYRWNDDKETLKNINLEIKEGEFVLITGKSGCGKSTLGSTINGLIPHYYKGQIEGKVLVCGQDISKLQLHEIGHLVGTVFQDPRSQFFTTTTDDEIAFGLQTICKDQEQLIRRVDEVYSELDIEELRSRSVFELSSGQKQKIAIASAYAMKTKVLILDEPSANLDMKATCDLFKVLEKLKKAGTTIILIEHRLYYARTLLDRLILIKDGEIINDLNNDEVSHLSSDYWQENSLRSINLEDCKVEAEKNDTNGKDIAVQGENICFSYPGKRKGDGYVLKNMEFKLPESASVGLIGLNGAGKTTFARILSGLEKTTEGVLRNGSFNRLKRSDLMRSAYFVFQDSDYQLFSESVQDELLLGLPAKDKKSHIQKAMSILKQLGLEGYKDKHPFALSRGEKQRLTIACGLMKKAGLFIYDEPTSGCDRTTMMTVSDLIKQQNRQGTAVLIISHDIEFLANTVSEVWHIEDGRIKQVIKMCNRNIRQITSIMTGGNTIE